ncbi:MAG: hypothetical protein KGH93_01060 [Patescibacteria group bacterium]|nr:hypothetical protein [Patescibacteria group bacterium]MDE1945770.1 hypothetical protein [Patescibacteria group bacterium]
MSEEKETSDIMTTIGIIIVILVLVVGAFYFFKARIAKQNQIAALRASLASSSQDLNNIQNEATSLDFTNLDSGVKNLK